MRCEEMREWLRTADLAELREMGNGVTATHIRGCVSCRTDAQRILEGTLRLGTTLRRRTRRRMTAIMAPLAVAAGIALFLFFHSWPGVVPPIASSTAAIPLEPVVDAPPPMASAPARDQVHRSAGTLARSARVDAIPVIAVAYAARTISVAAEPAPDPGPVPRPTVLHSSDPNITVLWFE
jgi:hypothetical protein